MVAYLVELFPFAERARGIGLEQIFGKIGGFFSTFVNPIALDAIDWKYMAIYCGWICFELIFVFLFYPETQGRTLEELAFRKLTSRAPLGLRPEANLLDSVRGQGSCRRGRRRRREADPLRGQCPDHHPRRGRKPRDAASQREDGVVGQCSLAFGREAFRYLSTRCFWVAAWRD